MDHTTTESFGLENCFINFLSSKNPESLSSLIIVFIKTCTDSFKLTKQLASPSFKQINNIIQNKQTIFLNIPKYKFTEKSLPISNLKPEEYLQEDDITILCETYYLCYKKNSNHSCIFP